MPDPSHRSVALRRRARRSAAFAAAALLMLGWSPAAAAQDFEIACPTDEERRVVELVNGERAALGLAPLALDVRLGASALRHSEDMGAGCFLSHTGSDGSSPGARVRDAGYDYYAGEVAGAGQRSAEQIVDGWMNSSGHYAIIMMASARHIGVGHVNRTPCVLAGYGFQVSDFWTANVGRDPAPAFGEEEHCSGEPGPAPCADGLDNDGDGLADFPEDPQCLDADDVSEMPACADGFDNDGDGLVDHPGDPGCRRAWSLREDPACDDGADNDGDGLADYPDDPECRTASQQSEFDAACGLGAELALLLPPVMWLRRRLRS